MAWYVFLWVKFDYKDIRKGRQKMASNVGNEIKENIDNLETKIDSKVTNIKTEAKSWILNFLSQNKKLLIWILVGIVSVIFLVMAFRSYGKDYVTEIIDSMVKKQVEMIDKNYTTEMKTRDAQLQNFQKRLSASEKISATLKKRVGDVEIKIKDRKPPATSGELRDRSNKLGFKPVN